MKIYLVTESDYDSFTIHGAFSTTEKAREFSKAMGWSYAVEEYDVDPDFSEWWETRVSMDRRGNVLGEPEARIHHTAPPTEELCLQRYGKWGEQTACMYYRAPTHDVKGAIKTADTLRAQMIVLGLWPDGIEANWPEEAIRSGQWEAGNEFERAWATRNLLIDSWFEQRPSAATTGQVVCPDCAHPCNEDATECANCCLIAEPRMVAFELLDRYVPPKYIPAWKLGGADA